MFLKKKRPSKSYDEKSKKPVINNLPQDPEEKKEPVPQKEMLIAEVKKVRKRVSMKKLLPQKMAEAAEREKSLPRQVLQVEDPVWA